MFKVLALSFIISLGLIGLSYSAGPFIDNNNGTITDNGTGLVWTKCGTDVNGVLLDYATNCTNAAQGRRVWANALNDCNTLAANGTTLKDGSVAGNWRLPNINEMMTLYDTTRWTPMFNTTYFPTLTGIYYITSTTYIDTPT